MNLIPTAPLTRSRTRITRLGVHLLFIGTFAMLGGALRGFNLLLVMAGLIVGALVMHWRISRRTLENLSVQRRLPSEAFAGKPFRVRYLVSNHGRLTPAWMIRIEDDIQRLQTGAESDRRFGKSMIAGNSPAIATATCAAGLIPARKSRRPNYDCTAPSRGVYRFGPVRMSTLFPFSLFDACKNVNATAEIYVYPQLLSLHGSWRKQLLGRSGGAATTARRSGATEGEFFGLREWKNGDSPKLIHWRTSARMNEPAVRQFEQQRRFDACLLIDSFAPRTGNVQRGMFSRNQDRFRERSNVDFERAISLAATLLVHLTGSPSNRMILSISGSMKSKSGNAVVIGGGSDAGKRVMLESLTALRPTDDPAIGDAIKAASDKVGVSRDLIIISPRSMESAISCEPSLSVALSPWTRRSAFQWIDVSSTEILRWVAEPNGQSNHSDASGRASSVDQGAW